MKSRWSQNTWVKVIVALGIFNLFVFLTVLFSSLFRMESRVRVNAFRNLELNMNNWIREVEYMLLNQNFDDLQLKMETIGSRDDLELAEIRNADGVVLASSKLSRIASLVSSNKGLSEKYILFKSDQGKKFLYQGDNLLIEGRYVAKLPKEAKVLRANRSGEFSVRFDMKNLIEIERLEILRSSLQFFLFSLAGSVLLGKWIQVRISRRLERLDLILREADEDSIRKIRFEEDRIGDEISRLGLAFENLLGRLSDSMEEMKASKQLEAKANQAKRQFLATMSHEMKTPIHSIVGYCDHLEENPDVEELKKVLPRIRCSGENLVSLINDSLDVDKIEAGKVVISHDAFVLSELTLALLHSCEIEFKQTGHTSKLELDSGMHGTYVGDTKHIGQIITNFLVNASKYSPQGMIKLGVKLIDQDSFSETIVFEVEDPGLALKEDRVEKLFNPYERDEYEVDSGIIGSGLGLYICKELSKQLKGRVGQKSSEHGRNVFFLELKLEKTEISTQENEVTSRSNLNRDPKGKVLVVDDNEDNWLLLQVRLQPSVSILHWSQNGENAIERFQKGERYDLVLMDLRMPGMDGIEATEVILKICPEQRIYALSAQSYDVDQDRCLEAGMKGFFSKPLSREKFREILSLL